MITTHELPPTERAAIFLFSSMRSFVACKFVWAGKLSITVLPITNVRFFSRVCSNVSFQMRTFVVHFGTSLERADMRFRSFFLGSFMYFSTLHCTRLARRGENRDYRHRARLDQSGNHVLVGLSQDDNLARREGLSVYGDRWTAASHRLDERRYHATGNNWLWNEKESLYTLATSRCAWRRARNKNRRPHSKRSPTRSTIDST